MDWRPEVLHPEKDADRIAEIRLLPGVRVFDTIVEQISELAKARHPKEQFSGSSLSERTQAIFEGRPKESFGMWVFYAWLNSLVHTLPEHDFVFVRTNRNFYKITPNEHDLLSTKKVGVVGLSVGAAVALALAMERSFGELRMADFDSLDLSNLNRIPQKISNLGLPKVIICARMLFEIDPFLNIKIFEQGLNQDNSDVFFSEGGLLDLVIDECDSFDIKVHIRHMAKKYKIPVVMETSDRGLLDIERFDQDPAQKIFHGLIGDPVPEDLAALTTEEKVPLVLKLVGIESASDRGKASLLEINHSLKTWPQLASSILHGGGVVADSARRILLGENIPSGRHYIDFNQLIPAIASEMHGVPSKPSQTLSEDLRTVAQLTGMIPINPNEDSSRLSPEQFQELVKAGQLAPSPGNSQPWLFTSKQGHLFLWQREKSNRDILDADDNATLLSHGACLENIILKAEAMGYQAITDFPKAPKPLIWRMHFRRCDSSSKVDNPLSARLAASIGSRKTERSLQQKVVFPSDFRTALEGVLADATGHQLYLIENATQIEKLADLIARADRIRVFGEKSHNELMHELRFSPQEVEATCDGIDVRSFHLQPVERVALELCRDWNTIKYLKDMNLGEGLLRFSSQLVRASAAIGLLTMKEDSFHSWIDAGRLAERIWLLSESFNMAFQPMTAMVYLLNIVNKDLIQDLDSWQIQELKKLEPQFQHAVGCTKNDTKTFLFRLAAASPQPRFMKRYPLDSVYFPLV